MFEKIINNKKLLIIIGIIIFVGLLFVLFIPRDNKLITDDEEVTDSTAAINDLDQEMQLVSENPILEILPITNKDPFYIIDSKYTVDNYELIFSSIEIFYKTEEGKEAATNLLKSPEYADYNPQQYKITYTLFTEE